MIRKVTSIVGLGLFGVAAAISLAAVPELKTTFGDKAEKAGASASKGVSFRPSSKYAAGPEGMKQWAEAGGASRGMTASTRNGVETQKRIASSVNLADYPLIHGFHHADGTWQTLSPLSNGVYNFHAAEGLELTPELSVVENPMTAVYAKGKYYLLYPERNDDAKTSTLTIKIYDATTWDLLDTKVLTDTNDAWTLWVRQVSAYDEATNSIYTETWGGVNKSLLAISLDDFSYKMYDGINKFLQTMFVYKGELYGITYNERKLYKIGKNDGKYTELGVLKAAGAEKMPFTLSADPQSAIYDPSTDKVYWIPVNGNKKFSYLYTLDPETLTIDLICEMPGDEHILGAFVEYAEPDAPAPCTGISYTDGKLNFTAPTATYTSGKALSGNLQAVIKVNGIEESPVNVAPGQKMSVALPLAEGEKYHITVAVKNAAGKSVDRLLNTFVGQDVPSAVTDLVLNNDDNATMKLTWNAPTVSMKGGPVADETINYRVTRHPDYVVVADNLKETSFSETVPSTHARYSYEVVAKSGDREGGVAESNIITAGEFWDVPYTEGFFTQDDFDSFKVIDANNDGLTWDYMNSQFTEEGSAYCHGNGTADVDTGVYEGHGNDDYLVSPFVNLKANVDYRISFESQDNWMTNEHFRLLYGTSREITGNEVEFFSQDINPNKPYSAVFHVPADGKYALFFHSDNPGQSVNVCIGHIKIEIVGANDAPAAVTNLKAKAGDKGAFNNTVSFNAPSKTHAGGSLSEITRIDVYREGTRLPIKTYENPVPGRAYSFIDRDVAQGSVTYNLVGFNATGQGETATVTNWIGLDVPAAVTNVKIRMTDDYRAEISFDKAAAVGGHGGYVVPDDVTYALYRYNEFNYTNHWEQVTEYTKDLTITDNSYALPDKQQWLDYIVVARNEAGDGEGAGTGTTIGKPYEIVWEESFKGAEPQAGPWTIAGGYYTFAMTDGSGIVVKAYDGDEGYLLMHRYNEASNHEAIMGPRVAMTGTKTPELSFYMYHGLDFEPEEGELHVFANYQDEGWNEIAVFPYNNGTTGWGRSSVALRNDVTDVQIAFGIDCLFSAIPIAVDAVKIAEGNASDLAMETISLAEKRINAGDDAVVKTSVANYGMTEARNLEVTLYKDGEPCATETVESLGAGATKVITFNVPTARKDASTFFQFQAKSSLQGDAVADNNATDVAAVYVKGSIYPTPENLTGSNDGNITLTWEKPAKSEVNDAALDDFDSYESFIIDNIGDWKVYDGDGTPTAYFGGPEIPNCYSPKAWQIWAPEEAGFAISKFEVLRPHSGAKYLACWAASDGVTTTLPNDDWLISPEIVGGTDVSFWYRMPNEGSDPQKFEILYSTSDQEPESFEVLDSDAITFGTDWFFFEYTLPEDARYFAIRSCSSGSYTVAFLDDITYTPLYGSTTELTLEGYNVYRDDQLIASSVKETSYVDNSAAEGEHVYNVTALWKEGESNYSNSALLKSNSVFSAVASEISVKALRGAIAVRGAEGLGLSVWTPAGVCIADRIAAAAETISVENGIYLVKVAGRTYKVIVK